MSFSYVRRVYDSILFIVTSFLNKKFYDEGIWFPIQVVKTLKHKSIKNAYKINNIYFPIRRLVRLNLKIFESNTFFLSLNQFLINFFIVKNVWNELVLKGSLVHFGLHKYSACYNTSKE